MAKKVAPTRESGTKSAATRARILDAAAAVLADHGFSATRLADVAGRAKVQAPAIYYYFSSREALIEEVIYVGIARLREAVETAVEALPDDTPTLTRIDVAVAAHLTSALRDSDYARAAIRNAQQVPAELRVRYRTEAARYDKIWSGLLAAAEADGALRPGLDVTVARFLVMGALNWTPEWWTPRRGSVAKVTEGAQDLIRSGIARG